MKGDSSCISFAKSLKLCETKIVECGSITDIDLLKANLSAICVPFEVCEMTCEDYEGFLEERRKLMAKKIKDFYYSL